MQTNKSTYLVLLILILSIKITIAQEKSSYISAHQSITKAPYLKSLFKKSDLKTSNLSTSYNIHQHLDSLTGDSIFNSIEESFILSYNAKVQEYITIYEKGLNIQFLNYLINYHSDNIKNELCENYLPEELHLLPAVCSGFNPNSTNALGGSGYWHLNYPQALRYGLTVNEFIDERKNIQKSTTAAIRYLKHLYLIYEDWDLTLAAYSCGPNHINNLLKRTKTKSYWEIYPYLNKNTRDIVPALQAMIYCYAQNNGNGNKIEPNFELDTFYIEHQLAFKAIEDVANIKAKELSFYNPTLNKRAFPANFEAVFPKSKMDKFYQLCDSIYYYQDSVLLKPVEKPEVEKLLIPTGTEPITYTVKSGDVLGVIADRYGVRVSQLQNWNNISGTRINIGQKLLIYAASTSKDRIRETKAPEPIYKEEKHPKPAPKSNEGYITYTVKSGDNLWVIAKKYPGISAQNIMDLNGSDGNLSVGQVLKIKKK